MKIAILSANLGKFDTNVESVMQDVSTDIEVTFHRFTDDDFPPIKGLSPRLQYRIPKCFGWQMFAGYDYYLWLDGSMSLQNPNSVKWFLEKIKDKDLAIFKHPWRHTIEEETAHVEEKLANGNPYIVSRYFNGLHKEQLDECFADPKFKDENLYASNVFMYKNNEKVQMMLKDWWYYGTRYFTVDQIALPYVIFQNDLKVAKLEEDVFKNDYVTLSSKHQ